VRHPVVFRPAEGPVEGPVTRLGGRPAWLDQPQWPISRGLAKPMFFLGQFRLDDGPAGEPRLAYVFMTDSLHLEQIEVPEGAEDDVGYDLDPALDTFDPVAGENAVLIQPGGRVPWFVTVQPADKPHMSYFAEDFLPADPLWVGDDGPWQFLGDEPVWLQSDQTPGPGWRLVAQFDSHLGLNFGDNGIGYVFVSPDGAEGRFLWQCH
jgi:hypothetical protein